MAQRAATGHSGPAEGRNGHLNLHKKTARGAAGWRAALRTARNIN